MAWNHKGKAQERHGHDGGYWVHPIKFRKRRALVIEQVVMSDFLATPAKLRPKAGCFGSQEPRELGFQGSTFHINTVIQPNKQ